MSPGLPPNGLSPEFAEAFLHCDSHIVLGRTVRPLALWHTLVLKHYRSPFVTLDRPATLTDLYLATEICQFDYGQWRIPRLPKSGVARQWALLRRFLRERKRDYPAEERAFSHYMRDFYALPSIYHKQTSTGNDYQAPEELALAAALIYHTKWSRQEVWMLPIGEMHHYLPCFAQLNGAEIKWATETKELRDEVRAHMRRYQQEKAARLKADPSSGQRKTNRKGRHLQRIKATP